MTRTNESEGCFLRFQPSLAMPLIYARQAFHGPTPSDTHTLLVRSQTGEPCQTLLLGFLTGLAIRFQALKLVIQVPDAL